MTTYRFIRWTLEPVSRHGRINNVVKVYFDIDSTAQQFFDPQSFIQFLSDEHGLQDKPALMVQVKKALRQYETKFSLDLKLNRITAFEDQKDAPTTLRQDILESLSEHEKAKRKRTSDMHSGLAHFQSSFFERIGTPNKR